MFAVALTCFVHVDNFVYAAGTGDGSSPKGDVANVENLSENFKIYRASGTGGLLFRIDEETNELSISEDGVDGKDVK